MKATHRLIDSVWTIEYEVVAEGKVKILNFSRSDQEGYDRERELPQGTLEETEKRIVVRLYLRPYQMSGWANEDNATEIYEVVNPMHVFDYQNQ